MLPSDQDMFTMVAILEAIKSSVTQTIESPNQV